MVTVHRAIIFHLSLVIVALIMGAGIPACGRGGPMEQSTSDAAYPFVVKHRLVSAVKEGWKCEAWLWATSLETNDPVGGAIRLTPEDKKTDSLPKVQVQLAIAHRGGKVARTAEVEPAFLECARMKKREESTYGNTSNKFDPFPPPAPCWELDLRDPFHSDGRLGGTHFEPDDYLVSIDVAIEGGPRFRFDKMSVTIESRTKKRH